MSGLWSNDINSRVAGNAAGPDVAQAGLRIGWIVHRRFNPRTGLVKRMKRKFASFWVGSPLGPIEQISALSFLAVGHELIVYSTGPIEGLPPGVELRDAGEIFSTRQIVTHRKSGSPALYSDLFRYSMLSSTEYTWVDFDVVALRPFPDEIDYLFGYESALEVNNAVLRLPMNSVALESLSRLGVDTRGYPPCLKGFRRLRYMAKSFGMGLHISDWPWGSTGPRAVTHYLNQTGEISHALPIEAFYPITFQQAGRFAEPGDLSFESFTTETYAVHLWGKALRQHIQKERGGLIPQGSFLHEAMERYSALSGFRIDSRMTGG